MVDGCRPGKFKFKHVAIACRLFQRVGEPVLYFFAESLIDGGMCTGDDSGRIGCGIKEKDGTPSD